MTKKNYFYLKSGQCLKDVDPERKFPFFRWSQRDTVNYFEPVDYDHVCKSASSLEHPDCILPQNARFVLFIDAHRGDHGPPRNSLGDPQGHPRRPFVNKNAIKSQNRGTLLEFSKELPRTPNQNLGKYPHFSLRTFLTG